MSAEDDRSPAPGSPGWGRVIAELLGRFIETGCGDQDDALDEAASLPLRDDPAFDPYLDRGISPTTDVVKTLEVLCGPPRRGG